MLIRFSEIKRARLRAADQSIGTVRDLLIENRPWLVRYLVVDLDNTLPTRKVLISPAAIQGFDIASRMFTTALPSRQVIESPPLEADQPISRQYERALVDYYGWPIYWLGRRVCGSPQAMKRMAGPEATACVNDEKQDCLRSANEVCGYRIENREGAAGFMKDLVINLNAWIVEYVTADPSSWLPKESSLFSVNRIQRVDWTNRSVHIELSKRHANSSCQKTISHPRNLPRDPCSAEPSSTA